MYRAGLTGVTSVENMVWKNPMISTVITGHKITAGITNARYPQFPDHIFHILPESVLIYVDLIYLRAEVFRGRSGYQRVKGLTSDRMIL